MDLQNKNVQYVYFHLSSGFFSSFTGVSCCHWINYSLEHQVQIKMYNTQQILKTNKDSLKRFDQYIVNIMIVKLAYILHLKTINTNYLHCNTYYQSYLFITDGIPSITNLKHSPRLWCHTCMFSENRAVLKSPGQIT